MGVTKKQTLLCENGSLREVTKMLYHHVHSSFIVEISRLWQLDIGTQGSAVRPGNASGVQVVGGARRSSTSRCTARCFTAKRATAIRECSINHRPLISGLLEYLFSRVATLEKRWDLPSKSSKPLKNLVHDN